MKFTIGTDASALTHLVQLRPASIQMIVTSTYGKCTYFPSSKTATSGHDSLPPVSKRLASLCISLLPSYECFSINIGDHQYTHHHWLIYRLSLFLSASCCSFFCLSRPQYIYCARYMLNATTSNTFEFSTIHFILE